MGAIGRRAVCAGLLLSPAAAVRAAPGGTLPGDTAWAFSFPSLDGGTVEFAGWRGRVMLVVNTASFCGFAPQFRTLEALNRGRGTDGLTVVGMPSNDFEQEADSNAKVKKLCELTYGVQFPMTGLTHVIGADANPFYAWVRRQRDWSPTWNFNKVVVGRDGRIAALFRAPDEPDGTAVTAALDAALAAPGT